MKKKIIFLCGVLLVTQVVTYGQKTQVSVQEGKVKAQTGAGQVIVDAGKKAILTQNKTPSIMVDDPMVDDVMQIYKWIEAEREAGEIKIDFSSIQINKIVNDHLLITAGLTEMSNMKLESNDTIRMGLTSILDEPKYYDLQGNLLPFDLDKVNERQGYYYLHFPDPVQPGGKFEIITVSEFNVSNEEIWKEGALWNIRLGNCTKNCLNFFRIILPESAIFVNSSRPVAMIDNFQGRVALTIRNYTGPEADGMYQISFLWPDKDGTSLVDLPAQYRGLQDETTNNLTEEYHKQMERILAGDIYEDLSTPMGALLTENCALVQKDKDLYIKLTYLCLKNPDYANKVREMNDEIWGQTKKYFVDELDFLSTPNWPAKPENGYIHPIYMCSKESQMRVDTLACIYENGKWYRFGNMGNAQDTDVSVFRKWLSGYEEQKASSKSTLDSLPWNNAGPEALEVYKELVAKDSEYIEPWFTLGIKLFGSGYWQEAFDCFQRCERLHSHKDTERYISSLIWQGHIYDIRGQRDLALQKYNSALDILDEYKNNNPGIKIEDYILVRHDQWGIVLNYKWIKERLETSFTREMIGK